MSQTTLIACHSCRCGYPVQQLYEVASARGEGYEDKVLICGPCYDKYQYGENHKERQ